MPDKCEHRRVRRMTWPDNGDSELCTDCLLTRHHWEEGDSGWRDHGYKSPADWYREAAEFEDSMTENIEQDKSTDSASGVDVQRVVMRRVVCAAIRDEREELLIGVRHFSPDMRKTMSYMQDFGRRFKREHTQGFVDQFGKFMDRREAWRVANEAGQIYRRVGGDESKGGTLYSENLY